MQWANEWLVTAKIAVGNDSWMGRCKATPTNQPNKQQQQQPRHLTTIDDHSAKSGQESKQQKKNNNGQIANKKEFRKNKENNKEINHKNCLIHKNKIEKLKILKWKKDRKTHQNNQQSFPRV